MKQTLLQAMLLLLLATTAAVAAWKLHPRAPALYQVEEPPRDDERTVAQIQKEWQGKVLWLDARTDEEFAKEHIPGARPLNEQHFQQQLFELLDTLQTIDKPVVIYCGGQKCEASRKVMEKLKEVVALEQCYVLKGGWPAWQAAQAGQ